MTEEARRAIVLIRECVDADRYVVAVHFARRMAERGLFWPDVQAVINNPMAVRSAGTDKYHRPKWLINGEAATGTQIEIVCAIETDHSGTEFITLYWND